MKVVILQPSYIPWRGYFHQIQKADRFVFYDDVQFDKRGWRNRNRIKTAQGSRWLTIPVHSRGHQLEHTPINAIEIAWETDWNRNHWQTVEQHYRAAPFFGRYADLVETFFNRHDARLVDFVIDFTVALAGELGLASDRFLRASALGASGARTERLLDLLRKVGASSYLSGPSARDYLDEALLAGAGIAVEYMTYDYPTYPQLYPPFDPQVSILDLLFMTGADAPRYIWEAREPKQRAA
jgi:hypothetical protein